jgi:RNA-directed DNA polymerase
MSHISEFDFLSYKFTRSGLRMSDRTVLKIKQRCARIIYNHLLLYPGRVSAYRRSRLGAGFRDWDLVTCINELRGYVYGGRYEHELQEYLSGMINIRNLSGAVSYFCLVEDSAIFSELDGWLVDSLWRAYRARRKILEAISGIRHRAISKRRMTDGSWYNFAAVAVNTRPPSFFTAWRAARKSWERHGLGGVDSSGMGYAYE